MTWTHTRRCTGCGQRYETASTGGRRSEYCGEACRAQAKAKRKKKEKARRREMQKLARVEYVDPMVVFARDGYACQGCGCPTPLSKRGTHEPDAPEVDHVVPLAKGGAHSYGNTQCLCRSCNIEKGADVISMEMFRERMLHGGNPKVQERNTF